jgi:ABC-type sugar transport system ATPase subunit
LKCWISDKADRRARGLTADEKQKISLGRGLVRYDVNAILFDEPLTVIDPHMKWQLRTKLKDLHRQLGHTMIYVTHDQTEALTFADKVVVMYEGEVVQIGTPEELFNEPAHTFVGYFIGSPGMNVIPCEINGKTARVGARIRLNSRAGYAVTGQRPSSAFARNSSPCHLTAAAIRFRSKPLKISGASRSCGPICRAMRSMRC